MTHCDKNAVGPDALLMFSKTKKTSRVVGGIEEVYKRISL
jgi:hypothetical protein